MTQRPSEQTAVAWRALTAGTVVADFPVSTVKLGLDVGHGQVRLGLGLDGSPQLLVPVGVGRRVPEELSGKAVKVRMVQYVVEGRSQNFMELRSTERNLDEAFHRLVDEILRRLSDGSPPEVAVAQAITDLRDLLRKERARSPQLLVGLFGELLVLEALLHTNPNSARTWTGPDAQRHDFSGAHLCVEVKSSIRRSTPVVHISSIHQLESPTDGRHLALIHFTLERTGTGGRSVRDLIEATRNRAANPVAIDSALEDLDLADWRQDVALSQERFGLLGRAGYRVEGEFPRLTRATLGPSLPLGVSQLEYDLDLTHAHEYLLEDTQVDKLLSDLAETE